jgi:hypothetical protein
LCDLPFRIQLIGDGAQQAKNDAAFRFLGFEFIVATLYGLRSTLALSAGDPLAAKALNERYPALLAQGCAALRRVGNPPCMSTLSWGIK